MNEIDKLYENAGVNPVCNTCELRGFKRLCPTKELCVRISFPFTAEKQIELIKWLMKYDEIHGDCDDEYGFSTLNYSGKYKKDFKEALASVINNELWQDLTEEERKQIKEILE